MSARLSVLCALWLTACGVDPCDRAALQERLDGASPGDVVSVDACTVNGSITVPPGVHLAGTVPTALAGPRTTIVATTGRAVTLAPGADAPTRISGVSIESDGCAAIVAIGAGRVVVEDVAVRATHGVGIAIEGASEATLRNVATLGPITADAIDDTAPVLAPFSCGSSALATHGVVLVDVATATLEQVSAEGFAAFGALAVRSNVTWTEGGAATILGAGIEVWGGTAVLNDVGVLDIRDGTGSIEAFGAVFGGGANVTSNGLFVSDSDGYGVFHDAANGAHVDLSAARNGFAGVWAQRVTALELTGTSTIEDNGFAGVAAIESTGVTLRDIAIARTVEGTRIVGVRTVRAGDGAHFVASDGAIENVTFTDNARVGLLLDLGGGSSTRVTVASATVSASGTSLGAVAQNGTIDAGWDDSVARLGATDANDAAFLGMLEIAGAVGPPCLPPVDQIDTAGISALIGP